MIELKITKNLTNYQDAVSFMEQRIENIAENKEKELIWLLEHPPLYTAGTSAKENELLYPFKLPVYKTGRGGKYTYHGDGQRIIYIMLNIKKRKLGVKEFVHKLEDWIILTLRDFNIKAEKRADRIGLWIINENNLEEKIAAIGIRIRKGISFHGIAVNIYPDLNNFKGIIPCGLSNFGITSMQKLGINISFNDFDKSLIKNFQKIFEENIS